MRYLPIVLLLIAGSASGQVVRYNAVRWPSVVTYLPRVAPMASKQVQPIKSPRRATSGFRAINGKLYDSDGHQVISYGGQSAATFTPAATYGKRPVRWAPVIRMPVNCDPITNT